jgi:hypothetical protein
MAQPHRVRCALLMLAALSLSAVARAEQLDQGRTVQDAPSWSHSVSSAAAAGAFLPWTLSARVGENSAQAAGFGGYDAARASARFESYAEARVWGPLSLRAGTELADARGELRPSLGGRLQLLSRERQGIDGSLAIFYRAEGFSEPEGEIETVVALGGRVERTQLLGNLAYGQDREGNERDGELRAAALVFVAGGLRLGADGRLRCDLGSTAMKLNTAREATYDLDLGPVAVLSLGPIALLGHVGSSLVRHFEARPELGVVALAGLGSAF